MQYVIIGNSAAGIGAAEGIRQIDTGGDITVISSEAHHVYSRPLIAHFLAGELEGERLFYRPPDFYRNFGVKAILGQSVTRIDFDHQEVILAGKDSIPFDRLLLACGSRAVAPPAQWGAPEGLVTFQTLDDARAIKVRMNKGPVVVAGAGLIGLRAAYGLNAAGVKVHLVELLPRILSRVLDEGASAMAGRLLQEEGVTLYTGCSITELLVEKNQVCGVVLSSGQKIACATLVWAAGVVPDTGLVKDTPVKTQRGILVNQYLQTTLSSVYAAGDVAETADIVRGEFRVNANWPNAHEQGRVAGRNMAGDGLRYAGSLSMNVVSIGRTPFVSLGLFDPREEGLTGYEDRFRINEKENIYQKLVFSGNRLKGAILAGDLGYCGAIKELIRDQTLVGIIKDSILEEKYQFYAFMRKKRQDKLEGMAVLWPESYTSKEIYHKSFNEAAWTQRERDERPWSGGRS